MGTFSLVRQGPRASRLAPVLLASVFGLFYVLANVRSADLAAHEFRAALFDSEGFSIWNGQWYGGHHTPAYSVLFPPLAALFGPKLVGVAGVVGAAAAFESLVRRHFGARARWGALWFGVGAAGMLFDGRLPFALGMAIGLGALVALQRERAVAAAALAAACTLTSPVAGAFLALAGAAVALTNAPLRRPALLMAALALAPPMFLALAFPEGGEQPFPFRALVAVELFVAAALLVLPRGERALRAGAWLYGAAAASTFALPTPMGSNVTRLAPLVGGPLLLCALARSRRPAWQLPALGALLALLAWWQLQPSVERVLRIGGTVNPAGEAVYYEPLLRFLEDAGGPPGRVEVPFTDTKRETADVAARFPLARGWERQLDIERNELFYDGSLDARTYERWLRENGVRWVALPDVSPDFSSKREFELVQAGLPYLRERWHDAHWRVYEVLPRPAMVLPEGGHRIRLAAMGADGARLSADGPGSALLRIHWTPYWKLEGGCVERAGDWTRVEARRAGDLRLSISFSPERVISRGRRCD